MKLFLTLLLLIPSLSWGDHKTKLDLDGYKYNELAKRLQILVYNKSDKRVFGSMFNWIVKFKDGTLREYKSESGVGFDCYPKTDCIFTIEFNREDFLELQLPKSHSN